MGIAGHSQAKPFSNGPLQGLLGYCIEERNSWIVGIYIFLPEKKSYEARAEY